MIRGSQEDFPIQMVKSESESCSVMSDFCDPMDCSPTRLLCPWDSLGKNTGMGCHFRLQGIFPTQGLNPGLPHCRWILCQLSHKGSSECAASINTHCKTINEHYFHILCFFPKSKSPLQLLLISKNRYQSRSSVKVK